ncbi:uncharacterized protein LOC135839059 [Planococcus citri]|uniref:uncharacterized protein LOC135839059 n=1 Tax=Planococcus citri TaxID=170843 RepID=UPI0031F734D7
MRNLIIVIFMLYYSAYSLGLEIPYGNNSLVIIDRLKQSTNFTIPCSDTDEVEWTVETTTRAKNFIQVEAPNKKNLVIEKPQEEDGGVYKCVSKKNPNLFMKIVVHVMM